MACTNCFQILLPACPGIIVINAVLLENTRYRWEITDKFGNIFNGISDTDATGLLAINIQDNPDIPKGIFMSFSGSFILKVFTYESPYLVTPASFNIDSTNYDCIEMLFKDYKPVISYFDPTSPVYVPPFIQPIEVIFINQIEVIVLHNLGYKPFVWIEDVPGHVIGGNVIHDSINQFTVTFDSPTSGVIHYR